MKRLTAEELDCLAGKLEQLELKEEEIRAHLIERIEAHGITPARAEKSKRILGARYQFTVTRGVATELKDAEIEGSRQACPAALFERLFRVVTKFKLADSATQVLAERLPKGVPRNLRMMFSRAVETKETGPRLRIEKLEV